MASSAPSRRGWVRGLAIRLIAGLFGRPRGHLHGKKVPDIFPPSFLLLTPFLLHLSSFTFPPSAASASMSAFAFSAFFGYYDAPSTNRGRIHAMHLQQTKSESRASGGPQYYFHTVPPAIKAFCVNAVPARSFWRHLTALRPVP